MKIEPEISFTFPKGRARTKWDPGGNSVKPLIIIIIILIMIMIMIMIMIIIILIIQRVSHSSSVKEAANYEEEMGLQLQLEYPNPTCIKHDSGEVITAEKLKAELRRCF